VRNRREESPVRIVATLGPATATRAGIERLARAGARVLRINLSHATPEEGLGYLALIREAEEKTGIPLLALGDLAGPKVRIGEVEEGTVLEQGDLLTISAAQAIGSRRGFSVERPEIVPALRVGSLVYVGDGEVQLEVVKAGKKSVTARVRIGGALGSRKGFFAHDLPVLRFDLTDKDRRHVKSLVPAGIDALALSFVQSPDDVRAVARLLPRKDRPLLVAKIETRSGVENAAAILDEVDALMVARGDLGFAIPFAELPHVQKHLIGLSLAHGKPVITATQMLESMTKNPVPTRAEVTDVANAILDGTDAVMLSGETATGRFPAETVATMHAIADEASARVIPRTFDVGSDADAVSAAVVRAASDVGARLIVVFTETGTTARHIARHRPQQPILALTTSPRTVRALQLSWGVHAVLVDSMTGIESGMDLARAWIAKASPVRLRRGEPFVVSAGLPVGQAGSTNLLLVQRM